MAFRIVIMTHNICDLISQNSVHISDIFGCYMTNINGMWNDWQIDYKKIIECKANRVQNIQIKVLNYAAVKRLEIKIGKVSLYLQILLVLFVLK